MTALDARREVADGRDPRIWRVAAVVCLGPFMTQLDSTVVNVSLATIREQLHATIDAAQWIIGGYLLALALMLPLNGWLVDRVGAKRLYLGCFSAFTLASMLCGAAHTINELILARLIQGTAGGLMAPMAQMMMARVAGRHLARVMGYTIVPVLIAPILGPVVAAAVLKYAGWPWLFYLNLPMGLLGVTLAAVLLPSDQEAIQKRPFDALGFILISPGLAFLLYGLPHASQPEGAAFFLVGVVLMGAFVWHATRSGGAALIDLRLFASRIFSAAAATQFLANGVLYARQFLVPLFLITGCALSTSQVGWLMVAMGAGMLVSFPLVGTLTERFGCRAVSAGGAAVALAGMLPLLWMTQHPLSPALTVVSLLCMGAGHGTISIPSMSAAYASVPKDKLAGATTAINIVQRVGGPIATTLLAAVLSLSVPHASATEPRSFLLPFLFLLIIHASIVLSAMFLPLRIPHKVIT